MLVVDFNTGTDISVVAILILRASAVFLNTAFRSGFKCKGVSTLYDEIVRLSGRRRIVVATVFADFCEHDGGDVVLGGDLVVTVEFRPLSSFQMELIGEKEGVCLRLIDEVRFVALSTGEGSPELTVVMG